MRTTIDFPPAVHRRLSELARRRHTSLSAVAVEVTMRGLAGLDEPVSVTTDPATGFPTLTLGRTITSADVADLLDDE